MIEIFFGDYYVASPIGSILQKILKIACVIFVMKRLLISMRPHASIVLRRPLTRSGSLLLKISPILMKKIALQLSLVSNTKEKSEKRVFGISFLQRITNLSYAKKIPKVPLLLKSTRLFLLKI